MTINVGAPATGLVGRDSELALLGRLLDSAENSRSDALLITGEAGVGKTALLRSLLEQARRFTTLQVQGIEIESELPFAGLSTLLAPIVDRIEAIPPQQRAVVEAALRGGPPSADNAFAVCAGTLSLLAAAADDAPLLVVVDDAQWIDAATARALIFTARRLMAEGIVLVFAVRDGSQSLFDGSQLPELRLGGLSANAARELLNRSSLRLRSEVAEQLIAASDGNALALVEVPPLLTDAQRRGDEPLPDPLPVGRGLQKTYASWTAGLSQDSQCALVVAAAERTGSVAIVTEALAALDITPHALEATERSGLVSLDGDIRFRHPLARAGVYYGAEPSLRRRAHRAIAVAISDDPLRRAWHLARAAIGPDEHVATALEAAAEQARARHSPASSARAWEDSARLTRDATARTRRLIEAADDYQLAGRLERARALVDDAAHSARDPGQLTRIACIRGHIELFRGLPHQAFGLLAEEAAKLERQAPALAARLWAEASLTAMPAGEATLALDAASRAYGLARDAGEDTELSATLAYANALILAGRSSEASAILASVDPLALVDPVAGGLALQAQIGLQSILCNFDTARTLGERVVAAARAASAPGALPFPLSALADIDYRTGRWQLARAEAEESYNLAKQTEQPNFMSYARVVLARVEAATGLEEACRAHVDEAVEIAARLGADAISMFAEGVLGLLDLGLGRYEDATIHSRRAARVSSKRGLREPALLQSAPDLIEAELRSGRVAAANEALMELAESADATGGLWARAATARYRALLSGDEDFEDHFRTAFGLYDGTTMPFERGRTELALGERRRRAGRRTDAREPLRRAASTFARLGAKPWASRAEAELRATGQTLHRAAEAHDQLTEQELQVALVVARGGTNREAAAELFLSPKTVDFHLGHIYRKLGIRSRVQLAGAISTLPGAAPENGESGLIR